MDTESLNEYKIIEWKQTYILVIEWILNFWVNVQLLNKSKFIE